MRQIVIVVLLIASVCAGRLGAQSTEEPLNRMKSLLPQLQAAGQTDVARQYAEAVADVIEQAKSNPAAKDRLAREITGLAKRGVSVPSREEKPTPAQTDEFVYAMQLADLLTRVDRQRFLEVVGDILADPQASPLYKSNIFSKVLGTRVALNVTNPNALPAYDKSVLSLAMRFVDRADGFRFTFGDRGTFRIYVNHLIGYSLPGGTLRLVPPMDREKGLAIARSLIASDKFLFVEKEWYMGQVAAFDPQVRQQYVRALKEHIDDPKMSKRLRVQYAEKLADMGELDRKKLDEVRGLPGDPNVLKYEVRSGEQPQPKEK